MKKIYVFFNQYWSTLDSNWTAAAIGLTVAVWFWLSYKEVKPKRKWAWCILLLYGMLVYSYTVLSRQQRIGNRYELRLFWSYAAVMQGRKDVLTFVIMNIFMLMPVGYLLSALGKSWKVTMLWGCAFSCLIELSQLITERGLCELDDIFHNSLGAWLGILLYSGVSRFLNGFRKNKGNTA